MPNRILNNLYRFIIWLMARTPGLRHADLPKVLGNNTERNLNLPGKLAFFSAPPTDCAAVQALWRSLHPVTGQHDLIRLGPRGDGGYLVPDDLEGIDACFSPGVSNVSGFELDCANRGMEVFLADASVETTPDSHPKFHFIKKFIGATTEGNFIAFPEWVEKCLPDSDRDLLLQIDIEGYEYESFLSMAPSLLNRFRVIVIEFHFLDYMYCDPVFRFYKQVFDKLLANHSCVHIHPNNVASSIRVKGYEFPQMAEFTFLRNDRVRNRSLSRQFTHPLDRDNDPTRPPLLLSPSTFRVSL